MPRYFFHVVRGATNILDPDGTELADLAAAQIKAVAVLMQAVRRDPLAISRGLAPAVLVMHENGTVAATAKMPENLPNIAGE